MARISGILQLLELIGDPIGLYVLDLACGEGFYTRLLRQRDAIARDRKPGGRFVTVNTNPAQDFATAPSHRRYGFETTLSGPLQDGAPLTWTFHLPDGSFSVEHYCLGIEAHETAMHAAGLRDVVWHALRVSPDGLAVVPPGEWDVVLDPPPVILHECRR